MAHRLLSDQGITKLQRSYRSKLQGRFKGKGFEFVDAEKLLNFYQLWLDDLFPKAKFVDGLAMIEKVGHSKRMHVMRREWIDEGKPKLEYVDSGDEHGPVDDHVAVTDADINRPDQGQVPTSAENGDKSSFGLGHGAESLFVPEEQHRSNKESDVPEEDDLDALLAEETARATPRINQKGTAPVEAEGEDDLDALLAEYDSRKAEKRPPERRSEKVTVDEEEDDLDAILAEQDAQAKPQLEEAPRPKKDEIDDLDALLAEQEDQPKPNAKPATTNREENDEQDDLDALNQASNDWIDSL